MLVYNPSFFDSVSPKFLRRVHNLLCDLANDGVKLNYIHVADFGVGNIPSAILLHRPDRRLAELNRIMNSWSALKGKAAIAEVNEKDGNPIFIDLDV